jgi:hypothetical protein
LVAGQEAPRITQAIDESRRITLLGNTHPLARPEFDQGAAPDNQPMNRIMLLLQWSPAQEASLRQLLDSQQSKLSPNFHRWIGPLEFGQRFGPSDADIQAVTGWIASHGFTVNHISLGKTIIEFSGNAGQIRSAFSTEMHKYVVDGREHWANASDPQIPEALAPVIVGPVSLNNFDIPAGRTSLSLPQRLKHEEVTSPADTFNSATYAIGPYDFATIYNSLPLWNSIPPIDGTGQTIALAEESDVCTAGSPDFTNPGACGSPARDDLQAFRSRYGLPLTLAAGGQAVQVILNGPNPGLIEPIPSVNPTTPNYESEAILDADVAGGVAKGAQIDLVVSQTTETTAGFALSAEYIVDNNLAPVFSVSFGNCQSNLGSTHSSYFETLWEQAAAQGITVVVSGGDQGSAACDDKTSQEASHGLAVNGIAATPFNVAVGGTDFNDAGKQSTYWKSSGTLSALSYIPEVPWNNSCAAEGISGCNGNPPASSLTVLAGGGGQSNCKVDSYCAKPAWQSGPAVTGFESTDGSRDIPDVSLYAAVGSSSHSAYVICESDMNTNDSPCPPFRFGGGTSAAAPAFAGIMAMVNQYMITQGDAGRQGNANYVLYPLASQQINASTLCDSSEVTSGNACTFYDITERNNSVPCVGGSPNCSTATGDPYGVLVDGSGNLAWSAGPGYDLATGLGSINVTNLVHNWPAVVGTFEPTATTLQLCTGTPQVCVSGGAGGSLAIAHGASVMVNVAVAPTTPGSGTPTGDAALIGTPNTLNNGSGSMSTGASPFVSKNSGTIPLSGGKASITTSYLVGGSYEVTAHYAGDGTFGASDSLEVNLIVTPESSSTSLSMLTDVANQLSASLGSGQTIPYGIPVLLRIAVSGENSLAQAPPTGQLTVTDNGAPLDGGTFALNNEGYAEVQNGLGPVPLLPVGQHSFAASYGGDNSYSSSQTAAATTLVVAPAITSLAVTASPATELAGKNVTLTATVTAPTGTVGGVGIAPTGTVTFFANGTQISGQPSYTPTPGVQSGYGLAENAANLVATLGYSAASTATITASYSGDANYMPSNYTTSPATDSVALTVVPYLISAQNTSTSNPIVIPAPGEQGYETLTVQLGAGTNSLTLACSVGPTTASGSPTCSFSNNTVTKSGTVTLALNTVAPSSALSRPDAPFRLLGAPLSCQAAAMLAIILLAVVSFLRRRYVWLLASVLLLVTLCATCGTTNTQPAGGASSPGTAPGVYTVSAYGLQSGSPPVTVYFQVE